MERRLQGEKLTRYWNGNSTWQSLNSGVRETSNWPRNRHFFESFYWLRILRIQPFKRNKKAFRLNNKLQYLEFCIGAVNGLKICNLVWWMYFWWGNKSIWEHATVILSKCSVSQTSYLKRFLRKSHGVARDFWKRYPLSFEFYCFIYYISRSVKSLTWLQINHPVSET